jgi:hypothetical protein
LHDTRVLYKVYKLTLDGWEMKNNKHYKHHKNISRLEDISKTGKFEGTPKLLLYYFYLIRERNRNEMMNLSLELAHVCYSALVWSNRTMPSFPPDLLQKSRMATTTTRVHFTTFQFVYFFKCLEKINCLFLFFQIFKLHIMQFAIYYRPKYIAAIYQISSLHQVRNLWLKSHSCIFEKKTLSPIEPK